jgi:hypothetical protein
MITMYQLPEGKCFGLLSSFVVHCLTSCLHCLIDPTGKTNKGIHLFGRAMLFPIGALAMYLYVRFKMSNEFDLLFDFTRNDKWYNVKLYTDGTMQKMFKGINQKGYGTTVGVVAHALGVSTKHVLHLCRVLGSKVLEMQEYIVRRRLGFLAIGTQRSKRVRIQIKVPMKVIRGMAGFYGRSGMHYNPRTAVPVPVELANGVFPWLEGCTDHLDAVEASTGILKPTAQQFLKHIRLMAQVVIQDVATLKLKHPEQCGDEYSLFKDNALFNGSRFMVSVFMVSVSVYLYCFWHRRLWLRERQTVQSRQQSKVFYQESTSSLPTYTMRSSKSRQGLTTWGYR